MVKHQGRNRVLLELEALENNYHELPEPYVVKAL